MIVEPKIRGFICTTAHPIGCARQVQDQIDYILARGSMGRGPKKALIIGASNGYGLATRIAAAFGCGAATLGIFFESPSDGKKTATAGWYNTVAFEKAARARGYYAKSLNGDAFSDEMKQQAVDIIRKDLGQVDLVVYSLAAPRRTHPKTGETFKSTLKPISRPYTNKSFDFDTNEVVSVTLEQASEEEIRNTIAVMGGEDWEMWIDRLLAEGLLAPQCLTVAYSYIGPEITHPVYRQGTIGAAKDHLEATAHRIDQKLAEMNGCAIVSVNKALVTQASSAIPFISLYIIFLMKTMKDKKIHEGCVEQIDRLFRERLYLNQGFKNIPVDAKGRVRMDDLEMRPEVQREVAETWAAVTTESINQFGGVDSYNQEFLKLFGFGLPGVDYSVDVDIDLKIDSIS